jgi:hypothetical protein
MARLLALVVPLVGVVTVPVTSQQAILHLPNFRCLCRVYAIEGSGTVTTPTTGGSGTVTTPTTGGSGTVTTDRYTLVQLCMQSHNNFSQPIVIKTKI